jgi:nitric oxide reductase NorE protein
MNTVAPEATTRALPGDLAMWFFILAELTVFAIFFVAFALARKLNLEEFITGRETLHASAGLINTFALITASYFVAKGVTALQQSSYSGASKNLWLAQACALVYVLTKSWEYQLLLNNNFDISTNTFYTLYFFMTGFHFMHVLLGMVILGFMQRGLAQNHDEHKSFSSFVSGACYWHMVDLVWIILFPLVYLL